VPTEGEAQHTARALDFEGKLVAVPRMALQAT
jgi:hypothetical protein